MPGYIPHWKEEPFNKLFKETSIHKIDHVGIPQFDMKATCNNYFDRMDFHHFWSVDEKIMASLDSSLRTTVVCDYDEKVKMPVFEPSPGKYVSQIEVPSLYARNSYHIMEAQVPSI